MITNGKNDRAKIRESKNVGMCKSLHVGKNNKTGLSTHQSLPQCQQENELVINFTKRGRVQAPISINGAKMVMVECFKFLGVNMTNDLLLINHTDVTAM